MVGCLSKLIIRCPESFSCFLKVITQMVRDYVYFKWHSFTMIAHKNFPFLFEICDNLFVVRVNFFCSCDLIDVFDGFQCINISMQVLRKVKAQNIQVVQDFLALRTLKFLLLLIFSHKPKKYLNYVHVCFR